MEKRLFVKQLLCVGSILTVLFACQPKQDETQSSAKPAVNQDVDDEDDDGDDGTYGDGSCGGACSQTPSYTIPSASESMDVEEASAEVLDIKEEVSEPVAIIQENATPVLSDASQEDLKEEILQLEAVNAIQIVPEYQD